MKVLVVVDMQQEFVSWLPEEKQEKLVNDVCCYVRERSKDSFIVFTKDTHSPESYYKFFESKKYPIHCIERSDEWDLHPMISAEVAKCVNKSKYGMVMVPKGTYAMHASEIGKYIADPLGNMLEEGDEVEFEVCGLTTDICVLANVVALNTFFPFSNITVLENLTFGTTRSKTLDALNVMDSMGIILKDAEIKEEEDDE